MTDKQQLEEIAGESKSGYIKIRLSFCHYLRGDGTAIVILSYILNILQMKSKNVKDCQALMRNGLWFRCPAKEIEKALGVHDGRRHRAMKKLVRHDILSMEYRKGKELWIKVNDYKISKIEEEMRQKPQNGMTRNPKTRPSETPKRGDRNPKTERLETPKRDDLYIYKNLSKNLPKESSRAAPAPHTLNGVHPVKGTAPGAALIEKDEEDSWIINYAKRLRAYAMKVDHAANSPAHRWELFINKVLKLVDQDASRLESVLSWLEKNPRHPKRPKLYFPSSFRACFLWIEELIKKSSATDVVISPEAQRLARDLIKSLNWPKGTREELPRCIELSIVNHRALRKQIVQLRANPPGASAARKEEHRRLFDLAAKLLGTEEVFLERWWIDIHEQISEWDGFSGHLKGFVFHRDHKLFQRMGADWMEARSSLSDWSKVMGLLT
jgi:hypothetical protein